MILDEIEWDLRGEEANLERIDAVLVRCYRDKTDCRALIVPAIVILEMVHVAEKLGSLERLEERVDSSARIFGVAVAGYRSPVTGEVVGIHASRSMPDWRVRFSDIAPTWPEPHPDEPPA